MDPMFLKFLQSIGAIAFVTDPTGESGSGGDPKSSEGGDKGGDPKSADGDEPLGDGGKKALVAERDARKQAEKDRDAAIARVKEFEDAGKTDDQKLRDEFEQLRTNLAAITQERDELVSEKATGKLRTEVLEAKDVPERLRKWVTGSTKEELEQSAAAVLEDFRDENPVNIPGPKKRETTPKVGVSAGGDLYDQLHGTSVG